MNCISSILKYLYNLQLFHERSKGTNGIHLNTDEFPKLCVCFLNESKICINLHFK